MQSDKSKTGKINLDKLFDNRILDDLAKVTGSAVGTLTGLRKEFEERMKSQFELFLSRMDLVTREEFEVVKEMAAKARREQEELKKRLAALEKKSSNTKTSGNGKSKGKK